MLVQVLGGLRVISYWIDTLVFKTEGNTYATLLHHPFLFRGKPTHAQEVAVHVRDQNDNATYASTRWVPTVRHFLACEDVAGGSQQSGGNVFFMKYGGPSGGSLLSGGVIIILRVIRRHILVCSRGPSCQPLDVQSTSDGCLSLSTLTTVRREHQGGGRR